MTVILLIMCLRASAVVTLTHGYNNATAFNYVALHCHSTNSHWIDPDCNYTLAELAAHFVTTNGFGAWSLTDHDRLTADPGGLPGVMIPGEEITMQDPIWKHTLALFITNVVDKTGKQPQTTINETVAQGALAAVVHPNSPDYLWSGAELASTTNYQLLEVITAWLLPEDTGIYLAEAKWDALLTAGRRVLGYSGIDHHCVYMTNAMNMVYTPGGSLSAYKSHLAGGNFTFGFNQQLRMSVTNGVIYASALGTNATFTWITSGPVTNKTTSSVTTDTFTPNGTEGYVRLRVMATGRGWTNVAFSQPIWISTNNATTYWYVDNAAVGSNNGNSWANAWQSPTNINWDLISAGDVIYISGGSSNKTYTEQFLIKKSGTSANPIIIRPGRDTGHNGMVIFENTTIRPYVDNGSRGYGIWIDGSRNSSFVGPTNFQQVLSGSTAITNNIGIWIRNLIGTNELSNTDPVVWYFSETPSYFRVSYVEVSGLSNTLCGEGCDWKGTVTYINSTAVGSNNVFEYLYLHDNTSQQFASGADGDWNAFEFKFGAIIHGGEDHFEVSSGWSIHDNIIGPYKGWGKIHNDMFQLTGDRIKIYNNDIRESGNAIVRIQAIGTGSPLASLRNNIWFFNNLVTEKVGRCDSGGTRTEPFTVVNFDPLHPSSKNTFSNIWFFNNLFYNTVTNTVGSASLTLNPLITWVRGGVTVVTNASVVGCQWLNNLIVDKEKGISLPITTNLIEAGWWDYSESDFLFNYNVMASTNTALTTPRLLVYSDIGTNLENHSLKMQNSTNYPAFVGAAADNFELKASDVSALNQGTNLSAYFNFDALNRPRNVGGAWDRGPLEMQESNLVVLLTFDNDTVPNATDDSGNGNDGKRFTLTEYNYPSNKVYNASGAPGLAFRAGFTGKYSDHLWRTGSYGLYNRDGGFFGVTNVESRLTTVSQMTVMVWARYNSAVRAVAGADYSYDGNATLLSGGSVATGTKGSWQLGRYNQRLWINNTRFVVQTNDGFSGGSSFGNSSDPVLGYGSGNQVFFQFPDDGFNNNGDTTNWYHYAVTFSNSVVRTYWNGTNYATGTIPTVTTLTLGDSASRAYNWVGVGANTHVGTPEYDDETGEDYPNNGFHNGGLDQVRIYDRALTQAEIVAIANQEGGNFVAEDDTPETASTMTVTGNVTVGGNLNVQGVSQ